MKDLRRFGGMTNEQMVAEILEALAARSWRAAIGNEVEDPTVHVCYVSTTAVRRDGRWIETVWMLARHLDGEFSLIAARGSPGDPGPWKQSIATQEQLSALWASATEWG